MNPLTEIISQEIRNAGWIPFDRFMELALYCPEYGFYETEADKVGRDGDFYTSPSVGKLFGELLAFRFADWLEAGQLTGSKPILVEAGVNRGRLAADIVKWMQQWRPDLFASLQYQIVEPSAAQRRRQETALASIEHKVQWVSSLQELDLHGACAIVFSNELLDAMPVRRFGWNARNAQWFEWGVGLERDYFIWVRATEPLPEEVSPTVPGELLAVLPDGYSVEVNSAALTWWRTAARCLEFGKLVAIDYGFTSDQWIIPERTEGTLRTYSRHRAGNDVLSSPGSQDITAHVNFTAVQQVGEGEGLQTERFTSQEAFLIGIAEETWKRPEAFAPWNAVQRRQFQTLVHPEHMGRAFKVLIQGRGGEA